ncbi:MAG TPA: NAD-dependent epimerase/dehydratase family protein [Thermoanaerobaculia bacterium]|nr:NAD-dependent epimerase/dehydratase family protein [Thermoanaerobaculia bacterium]
MKILIFGATGSAGGSTLRACLASPVVDEVRTITRKTLKLDHPKLRSFVHDDFLDFTPVAAAFDDVDALLFCLGVSATKVSSDEYRVITHDYAMAAANLLKARSPQSAFHFISGQGTRPGSKIMWSRVKGETENDLMDLVGAVCWRPSAIDGEPVGTYRMFQPFYRLLRPFRSLYIAGQDFGRAMLQATIEKMRRRVIENREIREIAERAKV